MVVDFPPVGMLYGPFISVREADLKFSLVVAEPDTKNARPSSAVDLMFSLFEMRWNGAEQDKNKVQSDWPWECSPSFVSLLINF